MRTSYEQNNYGEVLFNTVQTFLPLCAVELGVLDGYSTFHIARGLKGSPGHLDAYDLFDEYAYKHGNQAEVQKYLQSCKVEDYVTLKQGDAFEVHDNYQNGSVGFLHIDISNTGEIMNRLIDLWHPKIDVGGLICIEGGTVERDNVEWMREYHKGAIKTEIESNMIIKSSYVYATYLPFPGLTVCLRKR